MEPASAHVAGVTQEEWSQRWWQWAASFEPGDSPVADRSGERCAAKQVGDVWFLAGTYGSRRVERACNVPVGKFLFFPLVNYIVLPPVHRPVPCSGLRDYARDMTDKPAFLLLDIDGHRFEHLDTHRLASPDCFDLSGAGTLAASDGYWVMIRPLERGTHVLNFGGVLPELTQAVTYTLVVE